jgi:hypothetical protein
MFVLYCGLGLALLKIFNYDPFGVVGWVWDWFVKIVTSIADFLTGNEAFRKITSKPS